MSGGPQLQRQLPVIIDLLDPVQLASLHIFPGSYSDVCWSVSSHSLTQTVYVVSVQSVGLCACVTSHLQPLLKVR